LFVFIITILDLLRGQLAIITTNDDPRCIIDVTGITGVTIITGTPVDS